MKVLFYFGILKLEYYDHFKIDIEENQVEQI